MVPTKGPQLLYSTLLSSLALSDDPPAQMNRENQLQRTNEPVEFES